MEFFGGTVDVSHLVLTGNADDSLDWTNGWRGSARNVLIRQTDKADRGIEADNNGRDPSAAPRSQPTLANVTILGSGRGSAGILLREGTGAAIHNSLVTGGFADGCLDVDGAETAANRKKLTVRGSVLHCAGAGPDFVTEPGESWDPRSVVGWNDGGNRVVDPALAGYQPRAGSFLLDPSPNPAAQGYIGAVGAADWTRGWTVPGSLP